MSPQDAPWITFRLADQFYALSAEEVREMVPLSHVSVVPRVPEYVRGVVNMRGSVLPVIDLRRRLALEPFEAELNRLVSMMAQREQDHRKWVGELESCAQEGRAFKLNTDPHKCAFGLWYDHFKTDNFLLSSFLKKFDQPHKELHGTGVEVVHFIERGMLSEAQRVVRELKEMQFNVMMHLFSELESTLKESFREIALVVETGGRPYIAVVDSVESVERLSEEVEDLPPTVARDGENLIRGIARRQKDDALVLVLDAGRLFNPMLFEPETLPQA